MYQVPLLLLSGIVWLLFSSCSRPTGEDAKLSAVEDIGHAEKEFEKMAAEKGLAEAFWYFADSGAVILRGDSLVKGREGIRHFYAQPQYANVELTWSADSIYASRQGDLGYTYGHYHWQQKDSTGSAKTFTGIFHTVWKKQADGTWKYVWD